MWRWRRLIARRARRLETIGAAYLQMFAPDKLSVYPDRTARALADPRKGFGRAMARDPRVLDLIGPLSRARAEGDTYLRTDTHWTHRGYVAAYRAVCAALGAGPAAHVTEATPGAAAPVVFDLGRKVDPPEMEAFEAHDFPRRAVRVEANALMRHRDLHHAGGFAPGFLVGSRAVWRNTSPGIDPRRVVLFGDSYAFHHAGLGPMLAESFAELHLLWSSGIDWDYVERVRPHVVLHETAERFARMFPRDGVDLEALSEARVRAAVSGAALSAPPEL